MCGISGVISGRGVSPEDLNDLRLVDRQLRHRGPDQSGAHRDAHVALAVRRLSIVDLARGAQPLYNEDRSIVLVANGEIYNHRELRERLTRRGHRFHANSDCETIVHAYEEYGADCVDHLRGMFAFALWDNARRRLMLARDRMGEKPIYFYRDGERLFFASEMKALLRFGAVPRELSPRAIDLYFHYQYVPEPLTMLGGVAKLAAAHTLTVEVDPWRVSERRYWRMSDAAPLESDSPRILIRERLEEACALTARADVPIGVALSGGLDSNLIAALAARRRRPDDGNLHALSVGYRGRPPSDERAAARDAAESLGLEFHETELDVETLTSQFPALAKWADDPIADIAGFGYYAVMRLARDRQIPVVIQGQGGDELFWGYPLIKHAAHSLGQGGARDWKSLLSGATRRRRSGGGDEAPARLRRLLYDLAPDYRRAADEMGGHYDRRFAESLADAGASAAEAPAMLDFAAARPDVALTEFVCATYLLGNGVAQGDRLGMASSVEMRLPFADHLFVETVIGLRKTRTDVELPAKAWLKEAARGVLPERVIGRPKRGFEPPVREWHRALFAAHGDSLRDGYLTQNRVLGESGAAHLARGDFPRDATSPLSFRALTLEHWCRGVLASPSPND